MVSSGKIQLSIADSDCFGLLISLESWRMNVNIRSSLLRVESCVSWAVTRLFPKVGWQISVSQSSIGSQVISLDAGYPILIAAIWSLEFYILLRIKPKHVATCIALRDLKTFQRKNGESLTCRKITLCTRVNCVTKPKTSSFFGPLFFWVRRTKQQPKMIIKEDPDNLTCVRDPQSRVRIMYSIESIWTPESTSDTLTPMPTRRHFDQRQLRTWWMEPTIFSVRLVSRFQES